MATRPDAAPEVPRPVGAYVHSRRVGDLLFLAGCGPRDPRTDAVPGGPVVDPVSGAANDYDVAAQTHQVFDNVAAVLAAAGASLADIVDVQCFLVNIERDFTAFNAVYAERMVVEATRTTIGVAGLPPNGKNIAVEFKVVARLPKSATAAAAPTHPALALAATAAAATEAAVQSTAAVAAVQAPATAAPAARPLGALVPGWSTRPVPGIPAAGLAGRTVFLAPLDAAAHADALWEACSQDPTPQEPGTEGGYHMWDYLPTGPWADRAAFDEDLRNKAASTDFHFAAVLVPDTPGDVPSAAGRCVGFASIMRVFPELGSAEIGWVCFAPPLQRTTASTEALFLLMQTVMSLGYRRLEWKCDALNEPSRRAAQRLGFQFEGVFRQALVYKGRNRDTAWLSLIDAEWPRARAAISAWLAASNFDAHGRQQRRLEDFFATAS